MLSFFALVLFMPAEDPRLAQALEEIQSLKSKIAQVSSDLDQRITKSQKAFEALNYNAGRFGQDNIAQTVAQSVIPRPHYIGGMVGTQTLNKAVLTAFNFDSDSYNPIGMHDPVADKPNIYIPVDGAYLVAATCTINTVNANDIVQALLIRNGSSTGVGGLFVVPTAAGQAAFTVAGGLRLSMGDVIQVQGLWNTSGAGASTTGSAFVTVVQIQ